MTTTSKDFVIFSIEEPWLLELLNSFSLGQKWYSPTMNAPTLDKLFLQWNWIATRDEQHNITQLEYIGTKLHSDKNIITYLLPQLRRTCTFAVENEDGSRYVWLNSNELPRYIAVSP